jgi:carboxymethylenebutenolidase
MAARRDIDASVGYYGVGIDNYLGEAAKAKRPVLLHIAEEDGFVSKESQARMKSGLTAANFTLHSYPGRDHALARVGGKHYHGQDSATANKRTLDFFAKHLC